MVNTIRKMRNTNRKARWYYQSKGYKVFIKEHTRHSKDIFGVADGFYLTPSGRIVFIQIKTNQFGSTNKIEKFAKDYCVPFEVIMFKDREKEPHIKSFG